MMVIDGLFIIELFRKSWNRSRIESDDPIFNTVWGMAGLMRDLILLENQIPMFVLESLFQQITNPGQAEEPSLTEIILFFFNPLISKSKVTAREKAIKSKHLLDLLAKTLYPWSLYPSSHKKNKSNSGSLLPCVTDLGRAYMKFKKDTSITGSFLEINYENGVLKIPQFIVQDQTETLLRNLIALEQSCDGSTTYITSYAFLMHSLIKSGNDVGILRKNNIISHYLGDDEDVSSLFKNLCNEVTLANFYYDDICDKVNEYYNYPWNKSRDTIIILLIGAMPMIIVFGIVFLVFFQ